MIPPGQNAATIAVATVRAPAKRQNASGTPRAASWVASVRQDPNWPLPALACSRRLHAPGTCIRGAASLDYNHADQ